MIAQTHIIDTIEELEALEGEWSALVERVPLSTPFQLPVWVRTWWTHFGSGTLQTLAIRREQRLIAVVPLFLHEWDGHRQLTLVGTGLSDYLDFPAEPGCEASVRYALFDYLRNAAEARTWDVADWQDLASQDVLADLPGGTWKRSETCTETSLSGSFEDFWSLRSKDLRRNVRRYRERAAAEGAIAFEVSAALSESTLDSLVALHALRWQRQGESGTIAANSAESFLRAVLPEMSALGCTRTFILRFNEEIVAIILTFQYRGKIFSYLSAFDPKHEILGFGRLLLYEAFRHCYNEGIVAWNFLRGEEPYKYSFGAQPLPKFRLRLRSEAFRDIA